MWQEAEIVKSAKKSLLDEMGESGRMTNDELKEIEARATLLVAPLPRLGEPQHSHDIEHEIGFREAVKRDVLALISTVRQRDARISELESLHIALKSSGADAHVPLTSSSAELDNARAAIARIRGMAKVWLVDEDGTPYAEGVCDAARHVLQALDTSKA
jgi:hypothetical protein